MVTMKSKAILITGCDSGFGYSLVSHMSDNHQEFLTLACCYDSNSQGAKDLEQKKNVKVLTVDVTQQESIEKLLKEVEVIMKVEKLQLWAVVNNAATLVFADSIFQTDDMVVNQVAVNFIGCWRMSKYFAPHLIASKGRLVNVVSFCTECPLPTLSVYTATKAALMSLTNGMRMELAKYDVDVVLFNPGDHPGETPLCFGQKDNYDAMEAEVQNRFSSSGNKIMEHFQAYRAKFETTFPGRPALEPLKSPGLYANFDRILLEEKPLTFYVNSPWKTRLYFGFLKALPVRWSDKLRLALMRLPK